MVDRKKKLQSSPLQSPYGRRIRLNDHAILDLDRTGGYGFFLTFYIDKTHPA
jgi:hypothetical protein